MQLHVHVWDTSVSGDPIEEAELEHTDNYITGDETDHIQFSGVVQGKQIEIRLFTKDISYLIEEYIKSSNCGDATCSSCKLGVALERPLKQIDEAYNQGHRDGFKHGKEQRDHDIKRALEEMDKILTSGPFMDINEMKAILKKYTEA